MLTLDAPISSIQDPRTQEYLQSWKNRPANQGLTFPALMYTSEEIYELEKELFFSRTWIYVGHKSQLQGNGSYITNSIAERPLIIVQDQEGTLRAFHNICTHRAAPVAVGSGSCNRFICPYHAWTFDLEGALRGAPNFEGYEGFDPTQFSLGAVAVDTWGPFIFVNLDPDPQPLASQLGELPEMFDGYQFSDWVRIKAIDYYTDTNWKLYVENNAENYHEPMVHKSSYGKGEVSWNNSYHLIQCEARHFYYLQYSPYAPNSTEIVNGFNPGLAQSNLPPRLMKGTSVMSFWPNFAWISNPNLIVIYQIDPQAVDKTRIRWEWLVPNTPEALDPANLENLIASYDTVQQEDLDLLPEVQKGVESPGYRPGPLSPSREVGVHRFQELLMEYLTGIR